MSMSLFFMQVCSIVLESVWWGGGGVNLFKKLKKKKILKGIK